MEVYLIRFAKHTGRFEFDSLYKFATSFLKKKTPISVLQEQLEFETKSCEYEEIEWPKEEGKQEEEESQKEETRERPLYFEMPGADMGRKQDL